MHTIPTTQRKKTNTTTVCLVTSLKRFASIWRAILNSSSRAAYSVFLFSSLQEQEWAHAWLYKDYKKWLICVLTDHLYDILYLFALLWLFSFVLLHNYKIQCDSSCSKCIIWTLKPNRDIETVVVRTCTHFQITSNIASKDRGVPISHI